MSVMTELSQSWSDSNCCCPNKIHKRSNLSTFELSLFVECAPQRESQFLSSAEELLAGDGSCGMDGELVFFKGIVHCRVITLIVKPALVHEYMSSTDLTQ